MKGYQKARAESIIRNTAEEYFDLVKEITEELGIQENPGKLFTAYETGHTINSSPKESRCPERKRNKLTSKDNRCRKRRELSVAVVLLVCIILPIVIFECVRILESHKQNSPAGSSVQMTASVTLARPCFCNCYRILKITALLASAYMYRVDIPVIAVWKLELLSKTPWLFSPQANCTDRATAACRRS
jgi:hypothetical protein